ncbi:hypothetical protein C9I28_05545 [Pseudoduganella armeniaca]|uniref:Uncharacterized protein n=1 Tax=Pseudoduganella armeniaca TaxID=2072590 RepID=A0A2R4C6K5_9BURK|nr:hypothetical protein C9I28_05545 [Pseudoduganella armeniaca]
MRLFALYFADIDALNILRGLSLLDFFIKLIRTLTLFLFIFITLIRIAWRAARGTFCTFFPICIR